MLMNIRLILPVVATLLLASCASDEVVLIKESDLAPSEEKAFEIERSPDSESYQGLILDESDVQVGSAMMSIGGGYSYISANAILPPLEEGYFYEGWVVRSEPLDVVSTGALEQVEFEDGILDFRNNLELEGDFSEHVQYIITLEPDDGDPAPAAHVAETTFEALSR